MNVKEKLKVFRLENTNVGSVLIPTIRSRQALRADSFIWECSFHHGFYIVRGQPLDQLLAGVSYLFVPKKTLVSALIRVRRTPKVQPPDITTERRAISRPIARHYAASYLDIDRNNYVIIVPSGGNSYPSFVAGPSGQGGPANILDLYA